MAYQFTPNNTPANGGAAIFILKTLLKAQGWTVKSSSDGTTYNSSGDQITSNGSGAGGILNAEAWFVIQHPTISSKQACLQINSTPGTSAANWRVKYSYLAGFSGGSPGATQVPSAADEQVIIGAGTNAAPTFAALFAADGGYRYNCGCDPTTGSWYSFAFPTGGGAATHGMFCEVVVPLNAGDTDPWVAYANQSSPWGSAISTGLFGTYGNVLSGAPPALNVQTEQTSFVVDPFTSKDVGAYARIYKSGSNWKGRSTFFFLNTNTRATPTLETLVSTGDTVQIGQYLLPWPTGTSITI